MSMRNHIVILFFFGTANLFGQSVPESISKSFPKNQEIKVFDVADINLDGYDDFLIAVGGKEEEMDDTRTLYLYTSLDSGDFHMYLKSTEALYGAFDGPYAGHENLSSVELTPNYIAVHYYAGMTTRWAESHYFRYDNTSRIWYLYKSIETVDNIYDDEEPESDSTLFSIQDSIFISQAMDSLHRGE